jgi:TonB family protein
VDGQGRLTRCQTITEAPEGAGFGQAALALADYFQMKPVDREGRATAGQAVRIPMKFALPAAAK